MCAILHRGRFELLVIIDCFRIQDIFILFAVIIVFLLFFNTYIFQAGLVNILISKFKATILFVFVYLGLSIGLHVWGLVSVFS